MKSEKTLDRREIGKRLTYFRQQILGLTQAQFADQLGLTVRNIQIYEQATSDVSGEFYHRAFRQFGLDPIWLMTGEGAMARGNSKPRCARRSS